MTYLDDLLAGYRQGLVDNAPHPIQALRAALFETDDPMRRGALLGLLAQALASRAGSSETASTS